MKKLKMGALTTDKLEALIENIKSSSLSKDDKEFVVELLNFYDELKDRLKSSTISVKKLQAMLLGFNADNLKKLLQIQ